MLARGSARGYVSSVAVTAIATGVCYLMYGRIELSNLIMVYLVGVAVVASQFGPREAILCSVLSVATFDFLFVHPFGTFAVSDTQYVITFIVMLLVSLMISTLTLQVRSHARAAEEVQRLNETERLRNTLLTSISHDLRTPLTAIAGAADSLRNGEGETKALAETIYSESMRLNVQVQNLLDMTRLQWGEVRPNLEWQSVEEIVGSALARAEDQLKPRQVSTHIGPDLGLIRADGALLDRALANLLENIGRHTSANTSVEIRAERHNGFIRINVLDSGPGIEAGQEEAIFSQFSQGSGSSKSFGLGLAICRAIIQLHNGRIWAENRPEGGAAFTLELPRETEQPEVPSG